MYRRLQSIFRFPYSSVAKSSPKARKARCWRSPMLRKLKYLWWRLVRARATPEYIARGLAAGVFAGFFPLFGLQTIIGIGLAIVFRGHKLAAATATWVSNPLTYVPIYAINFQIGRWLLRSENDFVLDSVESIGELMAEKLQLVIPLFLGCAVMGLLSAVGSYFLGLKLIRQWRYRSHLRRRWRQKSSC